jgi:hypothetical protein
VRGDTVEIRDEHVDESGRSVRGLNRLDADGAERVTSNGYSIAASWAGAHELRTVARKAGEVVGGATYSVSADRRTLTIVDERGDSLIVLDRLIQ